MMVALIRKIFGKGTKKHRKEVRKIQVHLVQYVEKKFMEVDYNMLAQNHVHYNFVV
jgi:hypothetical protein